MSPRKKRVQKAIRLPLDLNKKIVQLAEQKHGGDFTATVVRLLYEAIEYEALVKRWKREGAARDAETKQVQRESHLEEKDGTSP